MRLKVCDPKSRYVVPASLCFFFGVLSHLISQFPQAFKDYEDYCKDVTALDLDARRQSLVGTCIITAVAYSELPPTSRIYIASLITSLDYGKNVDAPVDILENTRKAFQSLGDEIAQINADNFTNGIDPIDKVRTVRLNSGLFKVPWEETKAVLEKEVAQGRLQNDIYIVYPPGNEGGKKASKRKFDYTEGSSATPDSNDPSPADPSPVDSGSDDPSQISSPISSPATAHSKSVEIPKLRPSKRKVALDKTYKSTRGERTVSSARVKKSKDGDRQKRFTK